MHKEIAQKRLWLYKFFLETKYHFVHPIVGLQCFPKLQNTLKNYTL